MDSHSPTILQCHLLSRETVPKSHNPCQDACPQSHSHVKIHSCSPTTRVRMQTPMVPPPVSATFQKSHHPSQNVLLHSDHLSQNTLLHPTVWFSFTPTVPSSVRILLQSNHPSQLHSYSPTIQVSYILTVLPSDSVYCYSPIIWVSHIPTIPPSESGYSYNSTTCIPTVDFKLQNFNTRFSNRCID